MRIYGKPKINEKATSFNREIFQSKKRQIKKESDEENIENNAQIKEEKIIYNKLPKKNKVLKSKQKSVNKEYNRLSPHYYIEDQDKIKSMKHSSSTSKNFEYNFNMNESGNNSKNIDENLLFSKPNNSKDNKINNYLSMNKNKDEDLYEIESQSESVYKSKNKKGIYKSKIKSKNVLSEKLRNIIKKLSSSKRKKKTYFHKWIKKTFNQNEYEEIEVEEDEENSELEKVVERAQDEEESVNGLLQRSYKKKANKNTINESNRGTKKLALTNTKRYLFLKGIIEELDKYKNKSRAMSKWFLISKIKDKSKKDKKNLYQRNNLNKLEESDNIYLNDQKLAKTTYFNSFDSKEDINDSDNFPKILANSTNITDLMLNENAKKEKRRKKHLKTNKNENKENSEIRTIRDEENEYDNKVFNINDKKSVEEKIDEINKNHKSNKFQRYLLFKLPKSKKKRRDNFKIDNKRESFSNLNIKIKAEHFDKILLKILNKAYCRKNNLMRCFDKWFDITYNNKNYVPFLREEKIIPIIDKVNDSISISKESNGKSHKSKSKKPKKVKTEIKKVNSDEIDSKRNSLSSITNNLNDLKYSRVNINTDNSINKSKLSDSKYIKKKTKIKDKKSDDKSKDKKSKKKDKEKEKEEISEIKNTTIERKISEPKEEITKSTDYFPNLGTDKDSKSEIKFTGIDLIESDGNNMMKKSSNSIIKDKNGKKKYMFNHKRNKSNKSNNDNLISEDNIESIEKIINPNEESTYNDIENIINLDRSNDIDRSGIKNLKNNLKDKKQNEIDLKADFLELDMTHSDDNVKNRKYQNKYKKGRSIKGNEEDDIEKSNDDVRSVDIDKKYSKEERRLIKKYKKALHKLRVVLRSHRKRRKEQNTFNPDLEVKKIFQTWIIQAFPAGLDQYRIKKEMESSSNMSKSRDKSKRYKNKNKSRDKSDSEATKLKKLKHTIKLVNKKRKKLNSKSFEDIIIFFNKWKEIIRESNKELNKEKTKEKIKYITKEIIKDISKDKIKSINDNKDKNKELEQNNNKKVSYTYQKNDAIRPIKKSSRPVIDWNELSRDDSYSLYDESKCKDDIKLGLTKSQVIKIDDRPKRAKTQTKKDIDENDDDFYFMKIIERKQNKGMKRKLFDKISSQIEQNIKENYIEEHKKENADSFEIADDKDNNEKKTNLNENNKLNNLLSSEKKKRNKIAKESPINISNNNDLISFNSENLDSNKKSDNQSKNYLAFMSSSEKEKEKNNENERSRKKEKEKQREKELQREEELLRQKEKEKELQRQKEEKERENELQMQKEKERLEKEKLEKERERKEKIEKEKANNRTNKNNYIINPNQNKYDTPKKLLPAYDPYETKPEVTNPPKVQPPRQVLELEKLKGKSQLPDILRTSSFNRKKFGFGNLDYVEPGELVSNIKLRQIKDMIVRQQSDINIFSKSTFKGQTEKKKSFDFIPSSYSSRKYDSDNEMKKVISPQAKKKLADILKKVNNIKLKLKVEIFFKKWKNPFKYIKNMPNMKGIAMMDCAPPPKQEKKTSTIPVVFLSKSIIKDTKPFQFEEEKNSIESYNINNKYENNYENNNNVVNNSKNTFERYRKDSKPQKVKNGGRIEFVIPSQKEISNNNEIERQKMSSNKKYAYDEEEEEEIEEEGEGEIYDFRNYYNQEKKETRKAIRFVQKNDREYYNNYNLNTKRKDKKSSKEKSKKDNYYNNNYRNDNIKNKINQSEEKYKLLSPQIYNVNKICNRTKNNILNLMENAPKYLFTELNPELFINFTKKYNKEATAYHIFCLYSLFNQNYEFYNIRKIFNKWKKKIKRRFKRNKISKTNFYNCDNYGHCKGCICYKKRNKQTMMKNILFKFIFIKDYNPTKYYLNLWYKNTFL